mgnify:CR=1 FL=1
MPNKQIKNIVFGIQCGNLRKKIFKIILSKKTSDFYISLSYFKTQSYHCGTMTIPANVSTMKFNTVAKAKYSTIPLKFSYHKDGNIHFKPTNPQIKNLPLNYKLAKIQGTTIKDLNGEHVFTIQFEHLENFEDYDPKIINGQFNALMITPKKRKIFKFVAFAGFSENSIANKYLKTPCVKIEMKRPDLKNTLYIGIYGLAGSKSLQIENDNKPYLLTFVGFKKEHLDIKKPLNCLYLYAK